MPEIPAYPASRELLLDDRELLEKYFRSLQPRMSEMCFAGLYLFRHVHRYRLTSVNGSIVLLAQGWQGEPYFLPPLSGDRAAAAAVLLEQGNVLYCDDDFLPLLDFEGFDAVEDRDNHDYLHLRSELAELAGRRYHSKKNLVNYFVRRYRAEIASYSPGLEEGCLELLQRWKEFHAPMGGSVEEEAGAAAEGLRLAATLGLRGVVVTVEGEVKAFALGERLNAETVVQHFEKADPFVHGLYQFVAREFCRLHFTGCRFVNREQDLGKQNLRQTKLSYHPVELVRKWRVRRKEGEAGKIQML